MHEFCFDVGIEVTGTQVLTDQEIFKGFGLPLLISFL